MSSARFYFVPIHPAKNEKISIGWRISTTYTRKFILDKDFKSSGFNSHQLGLFAGTTIYFLKKTYFEMELGPGYDFVCAVFSNINCIWLLKKVNKKV